ncbi:hypothetical protein [Microbacterium sp. NPDC079995]|uniref:hypothetical protein n=1 Tax=unclassified Microbacterium TaxID=2609290 RepID=UPI0034502FE4
MTRPPEPNPWPDVIGPCYTDDSLLRELGTQEADITDAAHRLEILQLVTAEGVSVYPAFQVRNHQIMAGLNVVLRELTKGPYSPPMWAQWLNKSTRRPDGSTRRRIDELAAGELDALVLEARNTAAAWHSDDPRHAQLAPVRPALIEVADTRDGEKGSDSR